ncbi:MAG: hypothetical protein H0V97_09610 [Actinobacteria bacterium]|nr:hypothetical protein [Actinomycetota bacterium]
MIPTVYARPIHKADGRVIQPPGFEDLPEREPDPVAERARKAVARETEWRRIAAIPDYHERLAAEKRLRRRGVPPPMPGSLTP